MQNNLRLLMAVVISATLFMGAKPASDIPKRVDVTLDGKVVSLNTTDETVSQVLKSLNIKVTEQDVVTPDIEAIISDNMQITVGKSFVITVNVDGSPRLVRVNSSMTTGDVVKLMEDTFALKSRLVDANKDDAITVTTIINLVTSYTLQREETSEILFETVYIENDQVEEGNETVLNEGENGTLITTFEDLYEGDTFVSSTKASEKIVKPVVHKTIEKGTKKIENLVPGTDYRYSKVVTMRASAYTSDRGDSGTHTYTGERARVGLVAVDPNFIPLGTTMYIEGYGYARAADTGGMIKGNAIDLFFNTYDECIRFGRQPVVVYVLEQ